MFKKITRRSAISSVIACLTVVVICLGLVGSADPSAVFTTSQRWSISSTGWSLLCWQDYNTGAWTCFNWNFGSYFVSYNLPFGANRAYYLYDNDTRKWDEVIFLQDYNY